MTTSEPLPVASQTFEQYAAARTGTLAEILGFGDGVAETVSVVRNMMQPWGSNIIGETPQWHSDACADGSPFEFSMAIEHGPSEFRVLVEALAEAPNLVAMQTSARALTHVLVERYGASTRRLDLVEDLFFPKHPVGMTAMMHAAILRPGQPPAFKVYLNPMSHGLDQAPDVLQEALARLGFKHAWNSVIAFARRGFEADRIVYMSLDLLDTPHARVKVYLRQFNAEPQEIDEAMAISPRHRVGYVDKFCRGVSGHRGRFDAQPVGTCLAFVGEDDERPIGATFHVPLWTYSTDDEATRARICSTLTELGLPSDTYERGLRSVARRPLDQANGIHTYCSLKVPDGRPRVTVYWSPELYSSRPTIRHELLAAESA